jgi:hypothetical protein
MHHSIYKGRQIRAMQSAGIFRVALLLLCASPLVGHTDCWMIETTSGKTISSDDIWQIRNRITSKNELIGEVDGSKTSINLADVAEITVKQPGHRGKYDLHIRLLDEHTFMLRSDMDLYYFIEEKNKKKRLIQLADISSVNRCLDAPGSDSSVIPAVPAAAAAQVSKSGAVLATISGDILNGEITDDEFLWQTDYGEATFKLEDIKLIVLQCGSAQTGLLETISGNRMRGTMANQAIAVRLSSGQTLSVPASQIKYINRSGTRAGSQEIAAHCNNQ